MLAEIALADNLLILKDIESHIQSWYAGHGSAMEYHRYIQLERAITHRQSELDMFAVEDVAKALMVPKEYVLGWANKLKEKPW